MKKEVFIWKEILVLNGKIKQVLRRSLIEAGYLDSIKSTDLNSVLANYELIDGIKSNADYEALSAFNYFG